MQVKSSFIPSLSAQGFLLREASVTGGRRPAFAVSVRLPRFSYIDANIDLGHDNAGRETLRDNGQRLKGLLGLIDLLFVLRFSSSPPLYLRS